MLLHVTSHLECPRHEYEYDHWNWELVDGAIVQDYGFSGSLLSSIPENRSAIPDIKKLEIVEKKKIDQEASEEASLSIFRWFSITGEGCLSEKIFQDDWLQPTWEDSDFEADEADDHNTQELVDQNGAQIESWLDQIG